MGSKSYQRCLDSLNGHAGQALLLFLAGNAVIEGTNTHKDISAASVRSLRGKKTNDTQVVVRKWQHRHLKHAPILCKDAPSVYSQTHVTCLHFVQPKGIDKPLNIQVCQKKKAYDNNTMCSTHSVQNLGKKCDHSDRNLGQLRLALKFKRSFFELKFGQKKKVASNKQQQRQIANTQALRNTLIPGGKKQK